MIELSLQYRRTSENLCTGEVVSSAHGLRTTEKEFTDYEFKDTLIELHKALCLFAENREEVDAVSVLRTDREGLKPFVLDSATVDLLRTDPLGAVAAMSFVTQSPSMLAKRDREGRVARVIPPIRAGSDALADVFGDEICVRVRGHVLECPGCGFWSMFATPGLLKNTERAGGVFKTAFVCTKKCRQRFVVSCSEAWGWIRTSYLLENTKLESFYFPREWNPSKTWISRETLQEMFNQYTSEKERAS